MLKRYLNHTYLPGIFSGFNVHVHSGRPSCSLKHQCCSISHVYVSQTGIWSHDNGGRPSPLCLLYGIFAAACFQEELVMRQYLCMYPLKTWASFCRPLRQKPQSLTCLTACWLMIQRACVLSSLTSINYFPASLNAALIVQQL